MEESKRLRLKLTTATEVRRALTRVSNMVLNGELDPKRANAIILACNAILSSIRTDEQGKKCFIENTPRSLDLLFLMGG